MSERTISVAAQTNMDIVRAWVDAINRNDVDGQLACWQPDGEYYVVPTGTTYKGLDQIRESGENSAAVVGGQPLEGRKQITHLDAGDDWAVVEYDSDATIAGPIVIQNLTLLPEGENRTVVLRACVVFQMKDGKLDHGREYFDGFTMAQQLGLDRETLAKLYASLAAKADQPGQSPAARSPIGTVRRFIEAWNNKDIDALVDQFDAQLSARNPLSRQEKVFPKEMLRAALLNNMKQFPDLHMRVDRLVAEGDTVALEEFETATLAGTDKGYQMPVASFVRLNAEGKIVEMHNYWDAKTYFEQLGSDPETLAKLLSGPRPE